MVQRIGEVFLAKTSYYEDSYDGYYKRLGTRQFTPTRYRDFVQWMSQSIDLTKINRVLEVGSGNGEAILEFMQHYPDIDFEGVEPSLQNSEIANDAGAKTIAATFGKDFSSGKKYDMIYSNHVLQHTRDPNEFLSSVWNHLEPNGLAVLIIQDATIPSNELLYGDQNFSFMPEHLETLALKNGFSVKNVFEAPDSDSLLYSQLAILEKSNTGKKTITRKVDLDVLYQRRCEYMGIWKELDNFLTWKSKHYDRIIHFGAGIYTYTFHAYCPNYWENISFCTIETEGGQIFDKEVKTFSEISLSPETDLLILGVRPNVQAALYDRLRAAHPKLNIQTWSHFFSS